MKQPEKGQISLCHDHSIELTYKVFKVFIFIKIAFMSQICFMQLQSNIWVRKPYMLLKAYGYQIKINLQ